MDEPLIYARVFHLAATIAVAGVAWFFVLVAGPAFRTADMGMPRAVRRQLAWIGFIGLLVTVLSGAAWLLLVAQSMSERPLADVLSEGIFWTVLSETTFGRDWLLRLVLACLLAGLFLRLTTAKNDASFWIKLAVVALSAGLVGTLAWAGHAVGSSGIDGIVHPAADVLHLVAAAAWVGGLLPLVLVLGTIEGGAGSLAAARSVTLRFSALGVVAVGTLLVTGTINTWYLAGSITALTETDYGRLLLTKIALFLGMVAIAAVNRLRLTPRLVAGGNDRTTPRAWRELRRNALIEIVAGAAILAIVAALGVTPPGLDEQAMPHAHHQTH